MRNIEIIDTQRGEEDTRVGNVIIQGTYVLRTKISDNVGVVYLVPEGLVLKLSTTDLLTFLLILPPRNLSMKHDIGRRSTTLMFLLFLCQEREFLNIRSSYRPSVCIKI